MNETFLALSDFMKDNLNFTCFVMGGSAAYLWLKYLFDETIELKDIDVVIDLGGPIELNPNNDNSIIKKYNTNKRNYILDFFIKELKKNKYGLNIELLNRDDIGYIKTSKGDKDININFFINQFIYEELSLFKINRILNLNVIDKQSMIEEVKDTVDDLTIDLSFMKKNRDDYKESIDDIEDKLKRKKEILRIYKKY